MCIYQNGKIFGIRIYNFNDDDFANILFEEKYDEIMSGEQMREAYIPY
jgi:CRISPR/Cas system CMR-associated protein Cmr3 (group 5 of RAMP superfamily)